MKTGGNKTPDEIKNVVFCFFFGLGSTKRVIVGKKSTSARLLLKGD